MIIGVALCGLGTLLTCLNFYLSFLRFPVHRWRGGTETNYRWVSGFPVFGSLFLWIGAFPLSVTGHSVLAWTAIIISLFDTGGIHWFAGVMLYMWLFGQRS